MVFWENSCNLPTLWGPNSKYHIKNASSASDTNTILFTACICAECINRRQRYFPSLKRNGFNIAASTYYMIEGPSASMFNIEDGYECDNARLDCIQFVELMWNRAGTNTNHLLIPVLGIRILKGRVPFQLKNWKFLLAREGKHSFISLLNRLNLLKQWVISWCKVCSEFVCFEAMTENSF